MEENTKSSGHPEGCNCGMCKMGMRGGMWGMGGCGCHGHGPLHIILKILVILLVFWLGTQFGELRAWSQVGMMGSGYSRHYPMMNVGYGGGSGQAVPATVNVAPTQ